jgi:hypothetical protein
MWRNFFFEQAQTCSGFNPVIGIKIFSQDVDLDLNKQTTNISNKLNSIDHHDECHYWNRNY